ncbi:hypothetical protein JAAARDRAFT_158403 [Jaapia argillacea MUCL 33604]|uniref:Uncharacterized protein n=1 Tax=Jaapia argillacea MUCL 33604 TaxID=933084 RepID=A0A067Q184_9AGAM|nr:hypothetical protein JAAARDRAFT_158403 [Jaapia argillacea MUCL 33604]
MPSASSLFKIFVTASIGLSALVNAVPTSTFEGRALSFNPLNVNLQPIEKRDGFSAINPRTNAQRMAQGLPLLKPKRFSPFDRRTQPSSCIPSTVTGTIAVQDTSGGSQGYVSATTNGFGEYVLTTDSTAALTVTFTILCDTTTPVAISADNTNIPSYPFFGGVVGFSSTDNDLEPGSPNYVYIAGSASQSAALAPPQSSSNAFTAATGIPEDYENTIWYYTPGTGQLTPVWINSDGTPATTILAETQNILLLTGDYNSFQNSFGPTTELNFFFTA